MDDDSLEPRVLLARLNKDKLVVQESSRSKFGFNDVIKVKDGHYQGRMYDPVKKKQRAVPGTFPTALEAAQWLAAWQVAGSKEVILAQMGEPLPRKKRGSVKDDMSGEKTKKKPRGLLFAKKNRADRAVSVEDGENLSPHGSPAPAASPVPLYDVNGQVVGQCSREEKDLQPMMLVL
mmetsp:Transcript_26161/g.43274  ORF Transcript_26161/g.43274 Transcript_26161/m.43274 type:complete len:177 (-) Transcript_26161:105-635(-)